MVKGIINCLCMILPVLLRAQTTDIEFEELYKGLAIKKATFLIINKPDSTNAKAFRLANETFQLIDHLYSYLNKAHRLSETGSFSFAGNETKTNSVYRFGAGISVDQGTYPTVLNFSANIQTLLSNGVFASNESNIDISFDFHPYTPDAESTIKEYESKISEIKAEKNPNDIEKENNDYLLNKYNRKIENAYNASGLWLENYIVGQRFSDGYLGIDSRYEIGGGLIFSLYSNALTQKGNEINDEINVKASSAARAQDLIYNLKTCPANQNILQLNPNDVHIIADSRSRYLIANKKQYSKFRLSLLLGGHYMIEKTTLTNTIQFNGKDTSITVDYKPTNRFIAVIRPGLVWKPKDKYKFKIYPYFYLPFGNIKNVATDGINRDERLDYFIYLNSSFSIEVEQRFSISMYYRYWYDNAPNRVFLKQTDNTFVLLTGIPSKSSFGMEFNFNF